MVRRLGVADTYSPLPPNESSCCRAWVNIARANTATTPVTADVQKLQLPQIEHPTERIRRNHDGSCKLFA